MGVKTKIATVGPSRWNTPCALFTGIGRSASQYVRFQRISSVFLFYCPLLTWNARQYLVGLEEYNTHTLWKMSITSKNTSHYLDIIFILTSTGFQYTLYSVGLLPTESLHTLPGRGSRSASQRRRRAGVARGLTRPRRPARGRPPAPGASPRTLVERLDRRGTEPFELFRSEFGQNSVRIKEILLKFIRNSSKDFLIVETPTKFHQNLREIR